ncbi:hypothetical protein EVAR_13049_1 [Eumeta japonica]|uniref:Uncharacterized protein n=1 Tax=Eumeta variegata TaxID=151549 RepID=A0A4C1VHF6_EUMVA|nr:hypothetical protein EVAR_13049_1 [Eumeta japonica]
MKASIQINDDDSTPTAEATEAVQVDDTIASLSTLMHVYNSKLRDMRTKALNRESTESHNLRLFYLETQFGKNSLIGPVSGYYGGDRCDFIFRSSPFAPRALLQFPLRAFSTFADGNAAAACRDYARRFSDCRTPGNRVFIGVYRRIRETVRIEKHASDSERPRVYAAEDVEEIFRLSQEDPTTSTNVVARKLGLCQCTFEEQTSMEAREQVVTAALNSRNTRVVVCTSPVSWISIFVRGYKEMEG